MKDAALLISLQKILDATRKDGLKMVICFVDRSGHPHMLWRETGAWIGSLDLARRKAWSAIAFSGINESQGLGTEKLGTLAQPGKPLYGIESTNANDLTIIGGGLPIYIDDKLHGAVGVSGSTVPDDVRIAELAVAAYIDAYQGVAAKE